MYTQIKKEALAVTWACEKFSDYVLGGTLHNETDHEPFVPLSSTTDSLPLAYFDSDCGRQGTSIPLTTSQASCCTQRTYCQEHSSVTRIRRLTYKVKWSHTWLVLSTPCEPQLYVGKDTRKHKSRMPHVPKSCSTVVQDGE